MTIAVFPGSFDPLTYGHTDVVLRALSVFDRVVVAVLSNPEKKSLFSVEERVALINQEFAESGGRVEAKSFSGLLVDFVKTENAAVILRGLRAVSDYDYEAQMALMNRRLAEDIETLFLMTREKYSYVSSSLVKQIAQFGGDVRGLVPDRIADALIKKLGKAGKV